MTDFQVGDKVRVVRPFERISFPSLTLREGAEYTVTEVVREGTHGKSDYGINVNNGDGGYGSWDADRFELVEEGSPEIDIPAGVQQAHTQAAELFSLLAQTAYLSIVEQKPGHLAFVKELAKKVDKIMVSLEDEYPSLDEEVA